MKAKRSAIDERKKRSYEIHHLNDGQTDVDDSHRCGVDDWPSFGNVVFQ